ncbi:MAG TPA: HAD family hydrolase [Pyrinomonadaceae bacterium]|nr:HAD family hydrolase [Pyrinomonadaceae bacterium]
MTSGINTLLFDWDGTIVDSAHLGLQAFQKAFTELGEPFMLDVYESTYSPNWYATYEALGLPREKWQRADELWLVHYGDQLAELIEGVGDVLLGFHRDGYKLGVVSSGSHNRVRREIESAQLTDIFSVVICNDQVTNRKPHPEGLEKALEQISSRSDETVYVGDSPEDIQMGKAANVLTVGVKGSYPGNSRLLGAEPDIYLESLADLTNHL